MIQTISLISIIGAVLCAVVIAIHIIAGHRQRRWIMDVVWPITALCSGPSGL